jgi:hypothetical protein
MEMLKYYKFLLFKQFRQSKSIKSTEDKTKTKYLLKIKTEIFKANNIQIKQLIPLKI